VNFPYPDVVEIVNEEQFTISYQRFVQRKAVVNKIDYQNSALKFSLDEYFGVHHLNRLGAGSLSEDLGNKIVQMSKQE